MLDRFNKWIQESIMIKLFSIGFLIIILLIPASWIQDMIVERQQRAGQVIQEVADKWSGNQDRFRTDTGDTLSQAGNH